MALGQIQSGNGGAEGDRAGDDGEPEQRGGVRIVAADDADQHGRQRVAEGGAQHDQRDGVEGDAERIEHHDHADEAHGDRRPAPPADLLAEHRHRQRDHEEGRREGDGVGIDQRHAREDIEEARRAAEPCQDARRLQPGPIAAHDAEAARAPDDDRDRQHGDGAAEQHELERPVDAAQRLHHGVHGAEQHERAELEVDAEQGSVDRSVEHRAVDEGALFGLRAGLP